MAKKIKVGVLGATGMVGQRFIQLLEGHPWFEVSEVAASERSAGKNYIDALEGRWKQAAPVPKRIAGMTVKECKPGLDCSLVFGALDSSIAGPIEQDFAKADYAVSSNSKNHRMEADVPLLIPEINPGHIALIDAQKKNRGWKGFIVTNPNCTLMGPTMVMKALDDAFGVEKAFIVSMQAISGAGYPGVASWDIVDNVIPFISGEEEKVETEPLKILGKLRGNSVEFAPIKISASCNRVAVRDGHTCSVSVQLRKKASVEEAIKAMENFSGEPQKLKLPTAPERVIVVRGEQDRPQPIMDRDTGRGMSAVVGRVRECKLLDIKFSVLSHNTIRGAAGCAILNAELLKAKGYI
ncbi:MAG: aspartate-semialdehyde dehydrogenase [Candidatus Diapherotrites archaeon]|nr:aspartate-semialdehyde dehydrogenase [Candidatus Diapherotrites archaeon]